MSHTSTRTPPLVLVTGGKGGIGKTTIAANLAVELARLDARPVVCDLDFGLANLDVVLGLEVERSVESYLAGEAPFEDCLASGPLGLRVLAALPGCYERGRSDAVRRERLFSAFARLDAGVIVGDSPAGIGDDVLAFGLRADRVLVVTTPDPAAVTDAYGVIKALDAFACDQGVEVPTPDVFVNLARGAEEARSISAKLAGVCERFLIRSPRLVGWMPHASCVTRGVRGQHPFALAEPDALASQALARLARRYLGTGGFLPTAGVPSGTTGGRDAVR